MAIYILTANHTDTMNKKISMLKFDALCSCDNLCTSAEQADALGKTFPPLPAQET